MTSTSVFVLPGDRPYGLLCVCHVFDEEEYQDVGIKQHHNVQTYSHKYKMEHIMIGIVLQDQKIST